MHRLRPLRAIGVGQDDRGVDRVVSLPEDGRADRNRLTDSRLRRVGAALNHGRNLAHRNPVDQGAQWRFVHHRRSWVGCRHDGQPIGRSRFAAEGSADRFRRLDTTARLVETDVDVGRYLIRVRAIRRFTVRPVLPEVLKPLADLANNLRWCWHPDTQDLFRSVDPQLWESSGGDPIRLLADVSVERLQSLAGDKKFLKNLKVIQDDLADYLTGDLW